MQNRDVLFAKL